MQEPVIQPPNPPIPGRRVIIDGVDRTFDVAIGPNAKYEALVRQREVLGGQLNSLESQRTDLNAQIQRGAVQGASKAGVEKRIGTIDQRIADIEKQIAGVDAQVSAAAAVPGAVVPRMDMDMHRNQSPPEEAWILGVVFMLAVMMPISIAFARRIWRRGVTTATAIPAELMARLSRIEQAVDTSAVEIERIGEGQRFITKLFSESKVPALPSNKENR